MAALEGYDVIIKLRRSQIWSTHLAEFTVKSERYVKATKSKGTPIADLNMAETYLKELRVNVHAILNKTIYNLSVASIFQAAYDDFALFFYNPFGGDTIAVLWKPSVRIPKEFKVNTKIVT